MDYVKKGKCFIGIATYFCLMIMTSIIVSTIVDAFFNINNKLVLNLANLIAPTLTCIVIVIIYKEAFKNKFQDLRNNFKSYSKTMLQCYFLGFLFMTITTAIISSITGNIAINEEKNRTLVNSLPLYSIIATVFLAPICEELAFRYPFKNFSNNKNICALVSCIFFGLAHVIFSGDFIYIIPYAGFGYFLALDYLKTDNILTSILLHMFHNAWCILFILCGVAV